MNDIKLFYAAASSLLTLVAFAPYIWTIYKGETRPHAFSWIIWGITTLIVFFAQVEAEGGIGAWPTGLSALITFYIAWLAVLKRGDTEITRSDWGFFIASLVSIPVWYLSSDPFWAVVILTAVDTLAFGPTLRKAYVYPGQENITFFSLFILRNIFGLLALEVWSITNMLFHLVMTLGCLALIVLVLWRRHQLRPPLA
ncbi:MAG: hypothetical protein RL120_03815 [Gammaproteobacteria bacterium]